VTKLLRALLLTSICLSSAAFADTIPEIWKAKCKSCHGEDGKADTKTGKKEKIADMTTAAWQKEWTDEKQKTIILEGSKDNKKMKPFKDKLKAEEVDGLIKFIRELKQ
jgi:cytochrome c553